jgi:ribokinase
VSGRVVVVGSVNADLVVSVPALPGPGETVTGGTFARHGGGKGANQAVAAARMGANVALVAAVGEDDLGAAALEELAAEGIDLREVVRLADGTTGVALISVDAAGENSIAVASGANAALDAACVEAALGRLLRDGGGAAAGDDRETGVGAASGDGRGTGEGSRPRGVVLLGHEVPDDAVLAGARAARAAGWVPVLNPAPARALSPELVALAPLLTPNASEAATIAGEADPEAAGAALAARTGAPVLVTLGAQGVLLVDGERRERIPAPPTEVADTTGAGDTFNGALAAGLAAGRDLPAAARIAVAAASLSTRAAGARAGMPRADELPA